MGELAGTFAYFSELVHHRTLKRGAAHSSGPASELTGTFT